MSSIHPNVHDVARVATELAVVCPRLRQVHVVTTCLAFALLQTYPLSGESIYLNRGTGDDVRGMSWFRAIRPLSGLSSASIDFQGFHLYSYLPEEDHANIRANTTLVQSSFKQSATRALEAPQTEPLWRQNGLLYPLLRRLTTSQNMVYVYPQNNENRVIVALLIECADETA